MYLALTLTAQGYQVVAASDGFEAMKLFRHHAVDLVVLNIMIPGVNGFDICRQIKSISSVPVIVLSAKMSEADIVKAMGAHSGSVGSWETGIRALRERLEALGVPLANLSFVDGSGLSYRDKLSPRALVAALRIARSSFSVGPEFVAALPIAARDGTLEKRAEGARDAVRAKTGLLNRVTSLSGYARLPDGEVVAFSILANGYRVSDDAAMAALDRFAETLVTR